MFYDGLARKGTSEKVTPVMKKGTSHDRSRDRILLSKSSQIAMFNDGGERYDGILLLSNGSASSPLTQYRTSGEGGSGSGGQSITHSPASFLINIFWDYNCVIFPLLVPLSDFPPSCLLTSLLRFLRQGLSDQAGLKLHRSFCVYPILLISEQSCLSDLSPPFLVPSATVIYLVAAILFSERHVDFATSST